MTTLVTAIKNSMDKKEFTKFTRHHAIMYSLSKIEIIPESWTDKVTHYIVRYDFETTNNFKEYYITVAHPYEDGEYVREYIRLNWMN